MPSSANSPFPWPSSTRAVRPRPPATSAAEAACDQWHTAQRNEKPFPAALDLVAEFRNHRCRFGEFHALHSYIRRHLESGELPQPDDMVRALLPRANKLGLVYQCFRYDLPARG